MSRLLSLIVAVTAVIAVHPGVAFADKPARFGISADTRAAHPDQVLALAPAGSCIVHDGRIWHGFTAHRGQRPRRSIQGAFAAALE